MQHSHLATHNNSRKLSETKTRPLNIYQSSLEGSILVLTRCTHWANLPHGPFRNTEPTRDFNGKRTSHLVYDNNYARFQVPRYFRGLFYLFRFYAEERHGAHAHSRKLGSWDFLQALVTQSWGNRAIFSYSFYIICICSVHIYTAKLGVANRKRKCCLLLLFFLFFLLLLLLLLLFEFFLMWSSVAWKSSW